MLIFNAFFIIIYHYLIDVLTVSSATIIFDIYKHANIISRTMLMLKLVCRYSLNFKNNFYSSLRTYSTDSEENN